MKVKVYPSVVSGSLPAPASKSHTIRAVAAAMLAFGKTTLFHPSHGNDAEVMFDIARKSGATVISFPDRVEITGKSYLRQTTINCGESGLCARLMIALAALFTSEVTVTGRGTLLNRQLGDIIIPLNHLDVDCSSENGYLPFKIRGPIKAGNVIVDGALSSQFISGLMMVLPLLDENSILTVKNIKSAPYINLTTEVLKNFGVKIEKIANHQFFIPGKQIYQPSQISIEGDWSGAAFLAVAALVSGSLIITGLDPGSTQADANLKDFLLSAGLTFSQTDKQFYLSKNNIPAFTFDCSDSPDLMLPLAVLATCAEGPCTITGTDRLRYKESDRNAAIQQELGKLGIRMVAGDDKIVVYPGKIIGGETSSHHDHRIAMACAIAGLVAQSPVIIQDAECVSKSYPAFFDDLKSIGAHVETFTQE